MQKYIGNVIVNNLNYKIDECFNKCKSLDDIDNELPVLIIGLDKAKQNIDNFKILKREYSDGKIWWTLSKTEKRVDYDKNIVDFYTFCVKNIISKVVYKNIDIIKLKYSDSRYYIDYINNGNRKYYYIDNNKFIYIYDIKNSIIYGFSLNTAAFFGISKKKIIKLIEKNSNNIQITNFYSIPNTVRKIINDDVVSKIAIKQYF